MERRFPRANVSMALWAAFEFRCGGIDGRRLCACTASRVAAPLELVRRKSACVRGFLRCVESADSCCSRCLASGLPNSLVNNPTMSFTRQTGIRRRARRGRCSAHWASRPPSESARLAYCRQRLAAASRCADPYARLCAASPARTPGGRGAPQPGARCSSGSTTITWRPCAVGSSSSRSLCVGPRCLGGRIVLGPLRRPTLGPGSPDTGAGSGRAALAVSPSSQALYHAASRRQAPFVRAVATPPRRSSRKSGL